MNSRLGLQPSSEGFSQSHHLLGLVARRVVAPLPDHEEPDSVTVQNAYLAARLVLGGLHPADPVVAQWVTRLGTARQIAAGWTDQTRFAEVAPDLASVDAGVAALEKGQGRPRLATDAEASFLIPLYDHLWRLRGRLRQPGTVETFSASKQLWVERLSQALRLTLAKLNRSSPGFEVETSLGRLLSSTQAWLNAARRIKGKVPKGDDSLHRAPDRSMLLFALGTAIHASLSPAQRELLPLTLDERAVALREAVGSSDASLDWDAVLLHPSFVHESNPDQPLRDLTDRRKALISRGSEIVCRLQPPLEPAELARRARELELPNLTVFGPSAERSQLWKREAFLAESFLAVVGTLGQIP